MKQRPPRSFAHSPSADAFTLVEMLVSVAVLVLLVGIVSQLMSSATDTITRGRKHMDADGQARMIFDRMADDFGGMVRSTGVDYLFYKNVSAASTGSNDAMFFYSQAPAFSGTLTAGSQTNSVSLIGYRINPNNSYYSGIPVLERLGKGLQWDGPVTGTAPGGTVFLTFPGATPDPASTLAGNWSGTIGTAANNYADGIDSDYHVLSDQTFRLELAYLLNDGTLSIIPITNPSNTTTITSSPPLATSDSSAGYAVGSRWYDNSHGRGYICMNATPGAAVWSPIGIRDISAIIVAIAILDTTSRAIVTNTSKLAPTLADPTASDLSANPPKLMATTWLNAVNSTGFAQLAGLPQSAASQVRIYQRYFYLNYR